MTQAEDAISPDRLEQMQQAEGRIAEARRIAAVDDDCPDCPGPRAVDADGTIVSSHDGPVVDG